MIRIKANLFMAWVRCFISPLVVMIIVYWFNLASMDKDGWKEGFLALLPLTIAAVKASFVMLLLNFLICFVYVKLSKSYILLAREYILYKKNVIRYSDIAQVEYVACKWYMMPFFYLYKKNKGGLLTIRLENGREEYFRVVYKDYRIIRRWICSAKNVLFFEK